MVLQASGPLSFSQIQTEFGGVNPISLSEYYRGGLYMTDNNANVPNNGSFALSKLYSTYKTSALSDIINALNYTPYSDVRNYLISRNNIPDGFETNTAMTFNSSNSSTYRYSTTVTGTLNWPALASLPAAFAPLLKTSWITVIVMNVGNGALNNSLTVGGNPITLTNLINQSVGSLGVRIDIANIPVGVNYLGGATMTGTYIKGSSNNDNLQELFVLPGKWTLKQSVICADTTTGSLGSVNANDITLAIRTGGLDAYYNNGVWGGTATINQILRRNSKWYTDTTAAIATVTTGGTLNFNAQATGFAAFAYTLSCSQV